MHRCAENRARRHSGAAQPGWHVARVAALICALCATAAADETLRPTVTRRGWQVDFSGYVQVDSIAWSEESLDEVDADGEPLNQERFLIRRGRLHADIRRDDYVGSIEFDGNTIDGATARLLGASVGWVYAPDKAKPPLVVLSAGLMRIPFGLDVRAAERDKAFLEQPALARALFPGNYDAGVMASGAYGIARWSAAAMNGSPVADLQWQGKDPTSSFDFVGRVGFVLDGPRKSSFEAGVSALSGKGLHPGAAPTKDDIQWVDRNEDGFIQLNELTVIPGSPGEPSETYTRDALGVDAQVHWCLCKLGTGTAFFELAIARNLDRHLVYADPVAQSRDLRELGFAIGVVQNLGTHAQVGVRYDRYNGDRDKLENQGVDVIGADPTFSTLSLMASGRYKDARVLVQYDRERNPFGRDDTGAPATRSADRVTLRAQVGF